MEGCVCRSCRRAPDASNKCCAEGCHVSHAGSPLARPTRPAVRTATVALPSLQVKSESAPRYSRVEHLRAHATLEGEADVLGPDAQRLADRLAPGNHRPPRAVDDRPALARGEREQVHRRGADEARDENVGRQLVEVGRRSVLLDPPGVQQHHAIGHGHRLDLVMGDVDHGDPERALQVADLPAHLLAQLGVEIGERLVHEAHRGLGDDGASEGDPLLLPAGELAWLAIEEFGETEQCRDLVEAPFDLGSPGLAHPQAEDDVLGDRKMRKERIRLEHHRDVALRRRQARDVATGNAQPPAVGRLQAGDEAQGRGLAAAGGTEEHVERAFVEGEGDSVDGANLAVGSGPVLAEAFGDDGRHKDPARE